MAYAVCAPASCYRGSSPSTRRRSSASSKGCQSALSRTRRSMKAQGMPMWLLLACGLLCAPALVASQDLPPEVAPDRPSLTNSTQTVPVGALQIELVLEYVPSSLADSPSERRLAMQATLRAGLTDRLEVRLDSEPFVWLRQVQDHTGLGDVELGMKYRFFDPPEGGLVAVSGDRAHCKLAGGEHAHRIGADRLRRPPPRQSGLTLAVEP